MSRQMSLLYGDESLMHVCVFVEPVGLFANRDIKKNVKQFIKAGGKKDILGFIRHDKSDDPVAVHNLRVVSPAMEI